MALTETHWKLLCALSALTPAAALAAYAAREDEGLRCEVQTAADGGQQPGFTVLADRAGPACTRVELPPLQG